MAGDEVAPAKAVPGKLTFELTCDGPGWKALPVVNGHVCPVSSADVHVDPEGFPQVTLRLPATGLLKLGFSPALIKVDDETREALVSLGWTPPGTPLAPAAADCPGDWTAEQIAEFQKAWDEFQDRYPVRWVPVGAVPPEPDEMAAARPCGTECDC